MFVLGDFMGGDNHFDLAHVPALEKYCTWEQVYELCAKYDFKLGWHTWSHRDLTKLTRDEILEEVTPPFPMQYFAYPYGTYNDLVIECVKEVGFKVAYSVTQGSQDRTDPAYHFKIYRDYIR
jgi:peptidoglycan/xylan/chitin deacetylase (PgdA/CDA1 family)